MEQTCYTVIQKIMVSSRFHTFPAIVHSKFNPWNSTGQRFFSIPRIDEDADPADNTADAALKGSSQLMIACASLGWDLQLQDLVETRCWRMLDCYLCMY